LGPAAHTSDKLALVHCYADDLLQAARAAGTPVVEQARQFVSWLDVEFAKRRVVYHVGRVDGAIATLLRVHVDEATDALLIEALQTVPELQRQGLASELLAYVLSSEPGAYYADVDEDNAASNATFAGQGFVAEPMPGRRTIRWWRRSCQG